jgi:predicted enzyme related to lactoylglutathione lyase
VSLTIANVQLDVPADRYDEVVAFWATTLSATANVVDATYTHLVDATAEVGVHLQRLPAGEAPRIHLDLEADDAAAEVARLVELGATWHRRWDTVDVLTDPAGTWFCVVSDQRTEQVAARDRARAFLDAVVLDVPPAVQQETATFWAQALGLPPFVQNGPESPYLWSEGLRSTADRPLDLGVQWRADDGPARVHLDTISDDVAGEVARLTGLGASVVAEVPRWTVLADPVGNLFCVGEASSAPADHSA